MNEYISGKCSMCGNVVLYNCNHSCYDNRGTITLRYNPLEKTEDMIKDEQAEVARLIKILEL